MERVIIIGGGPAGAALGSYLSIAGISNVILEANNHPRSHVGESMVMSCLREFEDIGFIETLESHSFVRKYGAAWHEVKGRESAIRFADFPMDGINQDYTYHVDRAEFDMQLIKHAQKLGSEVYQGTRVHKVLFEGEKAVGVVVEIAGKRVELEASVIVDASGRATLLGRQLGLKENDQIFNQYAVHTWFRGVDRGETESADYIHIYFLPVERGWAWRIPISEEITSIGVVAEREEFRKFKGDAGAFFEEYVKSNEALAQSIAGAQRVKDYESEGDYSYTMKKFVGDGWILLGDAARFVDPIFSSGISIALASAKFASEVIQHGIKSGDFSKKVFEPYESKLRDGVQIWYEFIRLYYKLLPLFTHFIRSPKHRLEIYRLLQGDVYNREAVPVLDAMREYIEAVENNESHLLRGQLASIPIDDIPLPE